ncbi:zinc finger protein 37 [Stylonychia lemnae]|uniref:Zinc finger protein 37 n=1 Tax=Stylonychia lemnae TaxID=5949 RepID=A0A078AXR3_STYLE|nr:zinc finger protein 37 [Stylonychia lemnae]|eukprot:CDW86949.1 zinc finger protein 37 [Stylonychia lemnae]
MEKSQISYHLCLPYDSHFIRNLFLRISNPSRNKPTNHFYLKEHQCPYNGCSKIFAEKGNLIVHYRIHTGEKPFNCQYCEKKFTSTGNCNDHQRRHFKQKHYQLAKHLQKQHPYQSNIDNTLIVKTTFERNDFDQSLQAGANFKEFQNESIKSDLQQGKTNIQNFGSKDNNLSCPKVSVLYNQSVFPIGDYQNVVKISQKNAQSSNLNSPIQCRSTEEQDCSPSQYLVNQWDPFSRDSLSIDQSDDLYKSITSFSSLPLYQDSKIYDSSLKTTIMDNQLESQRQWK